MDLIWGQVTKNVCVCPSKFELSTIEDIALRMMKSLKQIMFLLLLLFCFSIPLNRWPTLHMSIFFSVIPKSSYHFSEFIFADKQYFISGAASTRSASRTRPEELGQMNINVNFSAHTTKRTLHHVSFVSSIFKL